MSFVERAKARAIERSSASLADTELLNALAEENRRLREFIGDIEAHAHTAWKKKARALLRELDQKADSGREG